VEHEGEPRTEDLVAELEQLRREVEEVHRDLLARLSRLCFSDGVAEKCATCARPCKQGSSVTVQSCPLYARLRDSGSPGH
jgi:hypothetical protein